MEKVHTENTPTESKNVGASEKPPIYDMPPADGPTTIGVAPVSSQPTATYVQVQPLVTTVPVVPTAPDYTSLCECDRIWCSVCWLK